MVSNQEQQLGKYRVLRLLGRGAFADVYLGQHLYLKSYAALKVLRTSLEDEDVTQFMTEAQTLARLVHPNIVRVLDFDVIRGSPMLVMEYSPGGTLRQRHPRGECLSLETTVTHVKQIAAALQYAHHHDVIHRDVKPENMLLGDHQVVRLSDFGIALLAPSPEQLSTQEMSGTIPYMAPEQLQGKPRQASDQYALGIVTYEWLCGVRPFEGNYWQLAHQHISSPPPPLREKDPSLPESVEAVVLKALAKDPQQRYGSVQLFAQALEQAAQAEALALREAFEVTTPLRAVSPVTPVAAAPAPRTVFLSAISSDAPFVARLSSDLQARGITIWNVPLEAAQPESDAREMLRQAMRAVDALLVVAAPGMQFSRLVKQHLQLAGLYKRLIIYLQTSSDETIETLPLVEHISIIEAHPAGYLAALDEIVTCIEREQSIASNEEVPAPEAEHTPRNPYKGLRAFHADDAQDFFGRDALITELTDQLRAMLSSQPSGSLRERLLAIIGPSGSGKSSVVMAGLLPRLTGGALPGTDKWIYLKPMVPGNHPIEALALTLAPHLPQRSVTSMREDLEEDVARGLHTLATQLTKTPDQKVVLLVDQFEELFTLTTAEAERQQFIDLLVAAATEPRGPLVVILTLRADFYDRPIDYPELGRLILRHQCLVPPMEVHELRAAVRQPAALPDVQLSFEGNLIGDLLYEVQGQAGALPLLQFTLDQLFQRRNGSMLTQAAYHEIGGVKGALAKHAEATYSELPSDQHRALARALFLRLIDPGATEQDTTRRRAPLDELTLATPEETELLKQVTAYFIVARLLTTSETAGTATIEVSHEALIREWPRLSDWLWEAREEVRLQQAISEDVAEWEQRGKPKDRLYRGAQLKDARMWAARNIPSQKEVAFLHASTIRGRRVLASVIALVLLLLSTTGVAGWFFFHQPPDPTHVTNLQDDGVGSLRWAIANAPSKSTITFGASVRGTIKLTTGGLNITKSLSIRGPGADSLVVSNGNTILVSATASITIANLTFKNSPIFNQGGKITLTNSSIIEGLSAGIDNRHGAVTLINSIVSGNSNSNNTPDYGAGGGINNVSGTVTLINSVVSGNYSSQGGGGIYNDGQSTVTLTNSVVSGNHSSFGGGGIYNDGMLTLSNSSVSDNKAQQGDGGGIYNSGIGTLTIANSIISSNTASNNGSSGNGDQETFTSTGGIDNEGGTLTITNSTISGNLASTTYYGSFGGPNFSNALVLSGGGITNSMGGTLTITNSTISGNLASTTYSTRDASNNPSIKLFVASGGGITNYGGILTITNSTISDNTVPTSRSFNGATFSNGGGITNFGGKANITFCTLYNNTVQDGANSIFTGNGKNFSGHEIVGHLQMRDSIVAGNHANSTLYILGTLTTYGYNLIQNFSGAKFDDPNNMHSTDISGDKFPNLGIDSMLHNKGGLTQTFALLPGSPAIDAIPLQFCQLTAIFDNQSKRYTDQRGYPRPDGNEQACDIGAYEYVD